SPDVNFWDERARELFEEIAEAFRVLGDPTARQMYDRYGPAVGAEDALPGGCAETTFTRSSSCRSPKGFGGRAFGSTSSGSRPVRSAAPAVPRKARDARRASVEASGAWSSLLAVA